jgi:hypothetical protein
MVKMWENWYIWVIKSKKMPVDISKLQRMKKMGGPKTGGPKKYSPKIQEVQVKEETSWGGESPMELKKKLGRQLLSLKLRESKLKEDTAQDWKSKVNLKSTQDAIKGTRAQMK